MAQLSRDIIADAGLAVANELGLDGFTIRAVAERLGVTPMALYHHVRDKQDLAAIVIEAALLTLPMPDPSGDWREDLWKMARWVRETERGHPSLSKLRRTYQVLAPSMVRMTQQWRALWAQAGFDAEHARLAANTSSLGIIGLVAEMGLLTRMEMPSEAMMKQMPSMEGVFRRTTDFDALFEMTARAIIDGVYATVTQKQKAVV